MSQSGKNSLATLVKTVLLTSLAFTVPVVAGRWFGWFEGSELAAYDAFIRQRPAEPRDNRIVIVTISDDDIEQLQQYPLHDATFATALEKLESYQPRAIGLDIARDVPQGPAAGRVRLQQAIVKSETIITGCLLSTKTYAGSPPAPGTPPEGIGFADLPLDPDKSVRRVTLVSVPAKPDRPVRTKHACNDASSNNEVYSLSFQAALSYLAASNIDPEPGPQGEIKLKQVILQRLNPQFGGYAQAETPDYQLMLNYRGAKQVFQEIPISEILRNDVDPGLIKDRVVLIGSTSRVSKDDFSTPYIDTQSDSRLIPGVIIHAHAVSQILSAVLDRRPLIQSWAEPIEMAWIWAWAVLGGVMAFYSRRLGIFVIGVAAVGSGLWGLCYWLFLSQGLWIPLVPALVTAGLTALTVRIGDVMNRSGYAQALYEQLREQMSGRDDGYSSRGDYLEKLVRRAQAARQGQVAAELLDQGSEPATFATPEMKALYEQIATRARAEAAAEQSARQTAIARQPNKARYMEDLLRRAQRSRKPGPAPTPPASEAPHE